MKLYEIIGKDKDGWSQEAYFLANDFDEALKTGRQILSQRYEGKVKHRIVSLEEKFELDEIEKESLK